MLLCELLQLLYYFYFFSSLCNFDPICNIVIYFLLVLNFATVICVLSINGKKNDFKETDFWMYVGAIPWIALNANNKILKWIRCFNGM